MLALGIASGAAATILTLVYFPECQSGRSSLWFCDESPEVVLGTLSFISSITAALAWPIAAIVFAMLFRHKIGSLLAQIKRIKAPGVEAEFSALVDRAESELSQTEYAPRGVEPPIQEPLLQYLKIDKKFAVLAAWIDIEAKLNAFADAHSGLTFSKKSNFPFRRESLEKLGFPKQLISAILDLRGARNAIAHAVDFDMTEEAVLRYLEIATEIQSFLDIKLNDSNQAQQP